MLIIKLKSGHELVVHVPFARNLTLLPHQLQEIEYIKTDGDESMQIYTQFLHRGTNTPTIPWNYYTDNHQQTWYGDIARTIIGNLI